MFFKRVNKKLKVKTGRKYLFLNRIFKNFMADFEKRKAAKLREIKHFIFLDFALIKWTEEVKIIKAIIIS